MCLAPEGTTSIEAGPGSDAPTVGTTLGEPTGDGIPFMWEFTPGEMPTTLVFFDADGETLATEDVLVS